MRSPVHLFAHFHNKSSDSYKEQGVISSFTALKKLSKAEVFSTVMGGSMKKSRNWESDILGVEENQDSID